MFVIIDNTQKAFILQGEDKTVSHVMSARNASQFATQAEAKQVADEAGLADYRIQAVYAG